MIPATNDAQFRLPERARKVNERSTDRQTFVFGHSNEFIHKTFAFDDVI